MSSPQKIKMEVLIILLILTFTSQVTPKQYKFDPARFTRSSITGHYQKGRLPKEADTKANDEGAGGNEDSDMISWLRRHSIKAGHASESDVKTVLNSINEMDRPEATRFQKIKVYNYDFGNGDIKQLLIFTDPDEEKQWIVNIEDLDMRQNLIVFPLGDLGFGFRKDDTMVVLRKSKSKTDPFHYINLVYLRTANKRKKHPTDIEVEWDNIKPQDLQPIPLSFREAKEDHANHCGSRKCGLQEFIFGTCSIVRLSCSIVHYLPINGHNKERVDALIREKQPFIYELAKTLTINQRYYDRANMTDSQELVDPDDYHPPSMDYRTKRSVKKAQAAIQSNVKSKIVVEDPNRKKRTMTAANKAPGTQDDEMPESLKESGVEFPTSSPINESKLEEKPIAENETSKGEGVLLPSSFDLLLVKNESFPSAGMHEVDKQPEKLKGLPRPIYYGNDTYFAMIIQKIRNSPPSKYTVRPLECIACEQMGTFLADYEEHVLVSYVANNIIANIFKNVTTRKNLFSPDPYDILHHHQSVPYIGYGSCGYDPSWISRTPISTELDDIIEFYTEGLGTNCHRSDNCELMEVANKMRQMLTSKLHLLEIWPDMSIRFNKTNSIAKNFILSTSEFKELMSALILSSYTIEYRMHSSHYSDKHYDNPNIANRHQSERMKFQTRVILRMIDELIKTYPQHLIKGLKYILQLLDDKYLSLVAEFVGINDFEFQDTHRNKTFYRTINRNDRLQVIALKDFIINGVAQISRNGVGSFPAFITYFNRNFKRILHFFVEYGIEFPPVLKGNRNQIRSLKEKELELVMKKMFQERPVIEAKVEVDEDEGNPIRKRFVKPAVKKS